MPWLLAFMAHIIRELPQDLNARITQTKDFEVAIFELDEQWSYVGNKKTPIGYGWLFILKQDK
jgi:hypothetical protein